MVHTEKKRVAAVKRFLNLKISKEKELTEILALAAKICGTETAHITLLDNDTQHVKYKIGLGDDTTARAISFCTHAIEQHEVMIVPDALNDERFWHNPLVHEYPYIRFYAGSPLTTKDGYNLGSLCVIDQKPGTLTETQMQLLNTLSNQVVTIFELEALIELLKEQYNKSKDSEIKLKSFFESSMTCHLLIDKRMKVVYFNKALSDSVFRVYGTTIEKGMDVIDFIPSTFVTDFINNFNTALGGQLVQSERKVDFERETIWWYITYEPAYNPDGDIIGVSYNTMDITDKAMQEQRIYEQNKALRAIAQIHSHELRAPVARITGLFDVWRADNYAHNEEIIEMLEFAAKELDEKIHEIIDHTPLL